MPQTGRDIQQAIGIDRDLFCGGCAYNLRTRSVVGVCPECGGRYDARPTRMAGILLPQDLKLPFVDFALAGAGGLISLLMFRVALTGQARWAYWVAVPFLIFTPILFILGIRQSARCLRHRRLMRAARAAEE